MIFISVVYLISKVYFDSIDLKFVVSGRDIRICHAIEMKVLKDFQMYVVG